MKKLFALLLAVLMVLSCFAACEKEPATDSEYVKKNGKLIVGITDYEPMTTKMQTANGPASMLNLQDSSPRNWVSKLSSSSLLTGARRSSS